MKAWRLDHLFPHGGHRGGTSAPHRTRGGVTFLGAPHLIHRHEWGGKKEWMAFFEDLDGKVLALMSQVTQSVPSA